MTSRKAKSPTFYVPSKGPAKGKNMLMDLWDYFSAIAQNVSKARVRLRNYLPGKKLFGWKKRLSKKCSDGSNKFEDGAILIGPKTTKAHEFNSEESLMAENVKEVLGDAGFPTSVETKLALQT